MGSKTPPFSEPSSDASCWDEARNASTLRREKTEQLLKRIADAVQVPVSAIYSSPDAVESEAPFPTASAAPAASNAECTELLAAFNLVRDPGDRRRLLELVQRMAERG